MGLWGILLKVAFALTILFVVLVIFSVIPFIVILGVVLIWLILAGFAQTQQPTIEE